VGGQAPVTDHGSTHSPGSVDRSPLVGVLFAEEASTDRSIRCVGSCTAHLEELVDPSDLVQGVGAEKKLDKEGFTADIGRVRRSRLQAVQIQRWCTRGRDEV
jgi:hypothetical protein